MGFLILQRQPYITDTAVHAPPTTGPYAYSPPYGSFMPGQVGFPAAGATYIDPVFRTTIRRLTANDPTAVDGNGTSDIYGKNGWWNADSTYFITQIDGALMVAVNTTTGAHKPLTNPGGATRPDMTCSPVDPDVVYYYTGATLKQQSIASGTVTTVKTFGATLGELGGSVDIIDDSGRYFVVNLGSPSFRIWDSQTDTLFTGAVTDSIANSGYVGIAPDASYLIVVDSGIQTRHAINTISQTLTVSGTVFHTGTGSHGAIPLCSDGILYFVRVNNDSNPAILERIAVATGTVTTFYTFPSDAYATAQPNHLSRVARGALRDWVFCSSDMESVPADSFAGTDPVATWGKMQSEIFMINILTGDLRRLAHTRSRQAEVYYYQPRVCASWDGSKVAWASNMGYESSPAGYADIWSLST